MTYPKYEKIYKKLQYYLYMITYNIQDNLLYNTYIHPYHQYIYNYLML